MNSFTDLQKKIFIIIIATILASIFLTVYLWEEDEEKSEIFATDFQNHKPRFDPKKSKKVNRGSDFQTYNISFHSSDNSTITGSDNRYTQEISSDIEKGGSSVNTSPSAKNKSGKEYQHKASGKKPIRGTRGKNLSENTEKKSAPYAKKQPKRVPYEKLSEEAQKLGINIDGLTAHQIKKEIQRRKEIIDNVFIDYVDSTFFESLNKKISPQLDNKKLEIYNAQILNDQDVIHNQAVQVLSLENIHLDNFMIPLNSVFYGQARVSSERFLIGLHWCKTPQGKDIDMRGYNIEIYDKNVIKGIYSYKAQERITQDFLDNTQQGLKSRDNTLEQATSRYDQFDPVNALTNSVGKFIEDKKRLVDITLNLKAGYPVYIGIQK